MTSVVMVLCGVLIALTLSTLNVLFARNMRAYNNLVRRGMARVQVKYSQGKTEKVIAGWTPSVDLNSVLSNPVCQSSAFIKVYVGEGREVVVAFNTVIELRVLDHTFMSVVTFQDIN